MVRQRAAPSYVWLILANKKTPAKCQGLALGLHPAAGTHRFHGYTACTVLTRTTVALLIRYSLGSRLHCVLHLPLARSGPFHCQPLFEPQRESGSTTPVILVATGIQGPDYAPARSWQQIFGGWTAASHPALSLRHNLHYTQEGLRIPVAAKVTGDSKIIERPWR